MTNFLKVITALPLITLACNLHAADKVSITTALQKMHNDCVVKKTDTSFCKGFKLGLRWNARQPAVTIFNTAGTNTRKGGTTSSGGALMKRPSNPFGVNGFPAGAKIMAIDPQRSGGYLR